MRNYKHYVYKGLALTLLIGLVYIFISQQIRDERAIQRNLLQNELRSFIVPRIEVKGVHYEIDKGVVWRKGEPVSLLSPLSLRESLPVLTIAHYVVTNRLDPIFALEGTDVDTFKESIEYLIRSLETFAPQYELDEEQIIREHLYPIKFLQSLAETEALRQELLLSPAGNLVEQYHTSLGTTITLYQNAIRRSQEIFENIDILKNNTDFYFIGGYTTTQHFISALAQLETFAGEARKKMEKRWKCFRGETKQCSLLSITMRHMTESMPRAYKNIQNISLPDTLWSNYYIISELYMSNRKDSQTYGTLHTPVVALTTSRCFSHIAPVYYYPYWGEDHGNKFLGIALLNNFYFHDLTPDKLGPYLTNIKKHDAQLAYLYEEPTELYLCPDMAQELSQSQTLLAIRTLLTNNPIFSQENNISNTQISTLARQEKDIITTDILFDTMIAEYTAALGVVLHNYTESGLRDLLGEEKVLMIEKILSIFHQGSAHFDEVINNAAITNSFLAVININSEGNRDIDSLFMSRSYLQLFFLTFNKSIIPTQLTFLEGLSQEVESPWLISYDTFLRHKFSPQEMIVMMKRGLKIERELLNDI